MAALVLLACTRDPCPVDGEALLRAHLDRYPSMEPADGYKLLHQASMGSEHAVPDPGTARDWMAREWGAMGEGPDEPLVDTLGAGGRFARVHLRPWRRAGGSPEALVEVFVATANTAASDTAALACTLGQMAALASRGGAPWVPDSVRTTVASARRAGYPAVHHSPGFEEAVRPAYRVVAIPLIPGLMASLSSSPRP